MNPARQQQPRVIGAVERSQSLMQSDMPQRVWISFRVALSALIGLGLIAGSAAALSAPIVRQVSGTLTHKGTITISGIGFGSKTNAAPVVWDDATASTLWVINDDGSSMQNPDTNAHSFWWNPAVNPMGGKWSKVEIAARLTNQTDGYVKVWENGQQVVNYAGATDKYPGTQRTIGIGGYARAQGFSGNWRYF